MESFEKFRFLGRENKSENLGEKKTKEMKSKNSAKITEVETKKVELQKNREELRELYEKEKREEMKKTIKELMDSGLPFVLRGSWAGEIISGIPSKHKDIDVYIEKKNWHEWENFLRKKNFEIEEAEECKKKIQKGKAFIDCHLWEEEENYYIEKASYGTFYFPKEGFIQYSYGDSAILLMSPELMWILKKGGPALDQERKKNLEKLKKFLDQKKLQEISKKFKFIPPKVNEGLSSGN